MGDLTSPDALVLERPINDILLNNKQVLTPHQPDTISSNPSTHSDSSSVANSSNNNSFGHDSFSTIPNTSKSSSSSFSNNIYKDGVTSLQSEQLLNHSHLKPGKDASLLSYAETINMYRENAQKTNNPDIQCDFAVFMIEAAKQLPDDNVNTKHQYISEAEKLLKQLSLKGHANAQYSLAKLFDSGLLGKRGKPELEKAFSLYVQASKHFHANASDRAAKCYEHGLGCRQNGTKAVQFFKKAASLGHPGSMYRLGLAYMNGEIGVSKNSKEAVKWLNLSVEAATPEYPDAIYELALLYISGIPNVIFVDLEYSVALLNQAAELGHSAAAFKLGECYEYGKLNVQPDSALSIHYYTIAAELGNKDACFALTAWYLVGSPSVLPQSDENAYVWAKRAADMGLPKAEYAVGYFSEVGIGCQKDPTQAIEWYRKAAENGDKRAIQKLQGKTIKKKIPAEKKKSLSQEDCIIM
ncbi:hypothetical protein [Parasitella parasitica]|uniref:HCP-like protein n=1 Tax=Parasitella parasitica TaxID=35722 RepID=A0A0B7NMV2_9FUNG|nr:hypothetical protein [Parasitella parasitica]